MAYPVQDTDVDLETVKTKAFDRNRFPSSVHTR